MNYARRQAIWTLYNVVAYQVAWFACVLGAASDLAWVGAAVALFVAAVHVMLTARVGGELKLIAAATAIGLLVDSALTRTGQIEFVAGVWAEGWAPYWMLALWAAFATTLNHSLRWVMDRPVVAAILGAVGGPLAYLAATRLGALEIPTPQMALPLIAAFWAAAMWTLSMVAARVRPSGTLPRIPSVTDQQQPQ
jgi:Protein of unknown function (DUF2878)